MLEDVMGASCIYQRMPLLESCICQKMLLASLADAKDMIVLHMSEDFVGASYIYERMSLESCICHKMMCCCRCCRLSTCDIVIVIICDVSCRISIRGHEMSILWPKRRRHVVKDLAMYY
jgi:hypothetical protein